MDIFPGGPFQRDKANFLAKRILFTKSMVVVYASIAPDYIVRRLEKEPNPKR